MAGQQRFWCPKSYNSVHPRKGMYGSEPNGYRTVRTCNHSFNSILLAWENFRIPSGPHIDHPTSNCQVRALWTYDENEQKKDISNQESMSFSDTNINKNSETLTNAKKLFGTSD